jgi:CheY-like chemotaxis protein
MAGQKIPPKKPQTTHELTPRDDARKIVSEILKRADLLIHKGDLDHAQVEITKAKAVDPRNVYVLALEERITILKAEIVQPEEPPYIEKLIPHPAAEIISETEPRAPHMPVPPSPTSTTILSQLSDVPAPATPKKQEDRMFDRSANVESYRQALAHAWFDGALTGYEEQQLNELRTVYGITKAEQEHMEKSVQLECYKNALLLQQMSDDSLAPSNAESNTDLQCTFQISDGEHLYIQTQLMNTIQSKQRDKVLIIDDDSRVLELFAASLEDCGFEVIALPTSDEAYALLRIYLPDLILCDINLETSTMGGFTFYEKVQELKSVQSIPFIFLTGLTDEALVRTGRELGADDYLLKPISEPTLVSTLRGKLKRFRQLNKIMAAPQSAIAAA